MHLILAVVRIGWTWSHNEKEYTAALHELSSISVDNKLNIEGLQIPEFHQLSRFSTFALPLFRPRQSTQCSRPHSVDPVKVHWVMWYYSISRLLLWFSWQSWCWCVHSSKIHPYGQQWTAYSFFEALYVCSTISNDSVEHSLDAYIALYFYTIN